MTDQIRTFAARVLPWQQTGVSRYFNVHWFTKSRKVRGRACLDLDELCKQIAWLKKQTDVQDIYLCMSSQLTAEAKQVANGRTIYWAERSLKGAVELKSLWYDVDVKAGSYDTTADAVAALGKFLADSKFPEPTLFVTTGSGGFHCHWVLDTALKPDAWKRLASAMVVAAKQHGFNIDPGVTTDAARILRVPDTLNYKHTPPKPAALSTRIRANDHRLVDMETVLAPYMVAQPAPLVTPGVGGNNVYKLINDELSGGIGGATFSFTDFVSAVDFLDAQTPSPFALGTWDGIRDLTFACVFIELTYPDHAADARALFEASVHRNGRKLDERMKDYDTNLQTMPAKIASGASVITPNTIFKMAMDKGWSKPAPAPTAQPGTPDPDLPPGYTREIDGTIWFTRTDKQGLSHQVQVAAGPMEKAWISRDPLALNFVTKIRKKDRTITVPHKDAARKDTIGATLIGQGFMLKPIQYTDAQEFILAWITHLQNTRRTSTAHAFGWTDGGFAYAGVIHGTGAPAGSCDQNTQRQYEPCGNIQRWMDCAKVITDQKRPALDAILASAFAGPLVKLMGQDGLLISAFSSESGIGKTTALRIAQAVWGHPIEAAQVLTDTLNATIHKLGEIRNLPMYWDEIKSEEQVQKFVDLAFTLSSGREKARLTQHAGQRKSGTWETLILSASNDSIVESIASVTNTSQAGVYRVFEFPVLPAATPSVLSQPAVHAMVADLKDHYGQVGLLYAAYLGGNTAHVEDEVKKLNVALFNAVKGVNEERYWIACITALVYGAHIGNQLGVTQIDIRGLRDFLVGQLVMMRSGNGLTSTSTKNVVNIADVLTRFMRDMQVRHTLFTDIVYSRPGRALPGAVSIVRSDQALNGVKVQIGLNDRIMRVGQRDLGQWLRDNKYSTQTLYKEFGLHFGMRDNVVGSLGSGTPHSTGKMRCFEFDLKSPQMSGYFDTI